MHFIYIFRTTTYIKFLHKAKSLTLFFSKTNIKFWMKLSMYNYQCAPNFIEKFLVKISNECLNELPKQCNILIATMWWTLTLTHIWFAFMALTITINITALPKTTLWTMRTTTINTSFILIIRAVVTSWNCNKLDKIFHAIYKIYTLTNISTANAANTVWSCIASF